MSRLSAEEDAVTLPAQAVSLMYHDVTDGDPSSGFQRQSARPYTLSRQLFDAHLTEIEDGPLRPDLIDRVDFTRPARHLFLTFDDGGRSAVHVARTLKERGWLGHFFIVTDRIGKPTFLTESDIRLIREMGHHIGSHSHTHPNIFWDLPFRRMTAEWKHSQEILSEILGEPCVSASVPGGDTSQTVLESAADAGVQYLFTSEPCLQTRTVGDCRVLGRLTVKSETSLMVLRARLEGRGWMRTLIERRLKLLARRTLAPMYRMYVRRTTGVSTSPAIAYSSPARLRKPEP